MLVLISSLLVIAFVKDGGGERYTIMFLVVNVSILLIFFVGVVVIMMVATLVSLVVV